MCSVFFVNDFKDEFYRLDIKYAENLFKFKSQL